MTWERPRIGTASCWSPVFMRGPMRPVVGYTVLTAHIVWCTSGLMVVNNPQLQRSSNQKPTKVIEKSIQATVQRLALALNKRLVVLSHGISAIACFLVRACKVRWPTIAKLGGHNDGPTVVASTRRHCEYLGRCGADHQDGSTLHDGRKLPARSLTPQGGKTGQRVQTPSMMIMPRGLRSATYW